MPTSDGFFTTDDGLRLFFKNVGEGPLVTLFLNGVPVIDDFASVSANRTIVCFDPRHRGRSDAVRNRSQLERGVHHDVDDLDAIRRALGVDQVDVIGHSYAGVTARTVRDRVLGSRATNRANRSDGTGTDAPVSRSLEQQRRDAGSKH